MIDIIHHGATTGVTGSCHELTLDLGAVPASPEQADRLVIESTYGDKDHESRETRRYRLKAILEHALADGGTVLIPAFSIGWLWHVCRRQGGKLP